MLRNYVKSAIRNLTKHRVRSAINIGGLALGLSCCILISLYVFQESQYDRFHSKSGRIFRVNFSLELNGNVYNEASVPFPAAQAFENDFPEVIKSVRLYREDQSVLVTVGEKKFMEDRLLFVDPSFYEMFDVEFLRGDGLTALKDPSSIILTEETAQKYFGTDDPVGKVLRYQNQADLKVTAVVSRFPDQSHIKFDALVPLSFQLNAWKSQTGTEGRENKWFWTGAWTYLLLSDQSSAVNIRSKMPAFVQKYYPDRIKAGVRMDLQRVTDIHLHSQLDNELEPNGDIFYVYVFGTVAVLTLLIAAINFVNLTTAQSLDRLKEMSVRKIVGAQTSELMLQVLCEFVAAGLVAMVVAVAAAELFLPYFNTVSGQSLSLERLHTLEGVLILVGASIAIGLLSGFYPALVFSKFKTGNAVVAKPWKRKESTRRILVISQFVISIVLIIALGVIGRQLTFIREMNLGFVKDRTVIVKGHGSVNSRYDVFRSELMKHPGIKAVCGLSDVPGEGVSVWRFVPEGGSREKPEALPLLLTDDDLPEALGIQMQDGRWFSKESPTDIREGFIINETAAMRLGWQGNALGKTMELFGPGTNTIAKSGKIVGVIKDYHFESLHRPMRPLVIAMDNDPAYYAVRLGTGDALTVLSYIESVWIKLSPERPIEYSFLDSRLEKIYRSEQKLSGVIGLFALLAAVIALLGLFGLSAYSAERRTKEIGIRKILGARVSRIITMLTSEYIQLIALSNVIAWPLGYVLLDRWLQNFAYRISVDWWPFVTAAVSAILLGVVTVSYHAFKAATANPVEALKYE